METAFPIFGSLVGGSAVSVVGIEYGRRQFQKRADRMRDTYELTFPRGMTEDHVLDFVRSVLSDTPTFKFMKSSSPVLFEKLGVGSARKYYLSIPHHLDDNVSVLLEAKIDGIYLHKIRREDDLVANTAWEVAVELGMRGRGPLQIDNIRAVSVNIDAKFTVLGEDEMLLLQWAIMPDKHHRPTPETKDKVSDRMLSAIGRIASTGPHAQRNLENLRSSLRGVSAEDALLTKRPVWNAPERVRTRAGRPYPISLNAKEFTALMGWQFDGSARPMSRRLQVHSSIPQDDGIYFASANHPRSRGKILRIPVSKLPEHEWIIGPTGTGKSALLHTKAEQFARRGMGFAVIEPKGDLARDVLESIPESRINDVIYFDPTDAANPIGLNLLAGPDPHRTTSHVVNLLHKKYPDSWGPRLEMFLKVGIFTAAYNGLSIFEVKEMMRNPEFRRPYVRRLTDASIKRDWRDVDSAGDAAVYSVTNKIDALAPNPMMQNIVGQITSGINMRDVILGKKILLVPLDSVGMGETNASIIGEILIDQLWMAARSIPENQRSVFPVIADEFQKFVESADSIEDMLALSRSYQLPFIGAHQYTAQLDRANKGILTAMKNNARTKIAFTMSPDDATKMADYFPPMKPIDLEMLGQHEIVASIMTDSGLAPSATGYTYPPPRPTGFGPRALAASKAQYSRPRAEVEAEIHSRYKSLDRDNKLPDIGEL